MEEKEREALTQHSVSRLVTISMFGESVDKSWVGNILHTHNGLMSTIKLS